MPYTRFISKQETRIMSDLINAIADAVFLNPDDADFIEEFIPEEGKVRPPKNRNFAAFLSAYPTSLWCVYNNESQDVIAGFILISNAPHTNAVGFGIKRQYAGQGIMHKAWEEIQNHPSISYPLNGYTLARNFKAINFMEKCGFQKNGTIYFEGEESVRMVHQGTSE